MKVMVTATQTTKMPWMRRVRANRAVARRLAARTARASSESRVVVGAVGDALVETVEEAADTGVPSVPVRRPRATTSLRSRPWEGVRTSAQVDC